MWGKELGKEGAACGEAGEAGEAGGVAAGSGGERREVVASDAEVVGWWAAAGARLW
eukprot:CAMPEP_0185503238 /NCGR_PEP_ID=MMETSP1366-20130426/31085_1 /TAXON_ID=38817 /ORGANISM="Gephyrocapsa oceanica, Strain RCC1303" /LENGTH=55 /DNA_ID=CAMNT_0028113013 /DNA_START=3 /DNA_END=167 /DNA_ORIENTATION=-